MGGEILSKQKRLENEKNNPWMKGWRQMTKLGYRPEDFFVCASARNLVLSPSVISNEAAMSVLGGLPRLNDPSIKPDFFVTLTDSDAASMRAVTSDETEVLSVDDLINLAQLKFACHQYSEQLKGYGVKIVLLLWAGVTEFGIEEWNDEYKDRGFMREVHRKNPPYFSELYDDIDEYSDAYIDELFREIPVFEDGGMIKFSDSYGEFLNVIGGDRLTPDTPPEYAHTIHIFGGCWGFGYGADDRNTMAATLQRHVNEASGGLENAKWQVSNHGVYFHNIVGGLLAYQLGEQVLLRVKEGDILPGDVVVDVLHCRYHQAPSKNQKKAAAWIRAFTKGDLGIDTIDLYETLRFAQASSKTYVDRHHVNHKGQRAVADKLFDEYIREVVGTD
ncbi:hypothetical protein AGMMS49957_13170 [Synergistales bacterium]|nr:hypothetical protein AGMMS49957_13170 [Synergistales bacterium]